jgi:hypothetical protein
MLRKKVKGPRNNKVGLGLGWVWFDCNTTVCVFRLSVVPGGGKCPEEEHTTCSGGPTIIIVTSAVYGERENYSLKKRIIYRRE